MFFTEFANFLESAVLCPDRLLITGDFNIHFDTDSDIDAIRLHDLFESVGLEQHVEHPTNVCVHTLDLIVTRQTDQIIDSTPQVDYLFSDLFSANYELKRPLWKSPVFLAGKLSLLI